MLKMVVGVEAVVREWVGLDKSVLLSAKGCEEGGCLEEVGEKGDDGRGGCFVPGKDEEEGFVCQFGFC